MPEMPPLKLLPFQDVAWRTQHRRDSLRHDYLLVKPVILLELKRCSTHG
jgi:hypothetical protein